MTGRQSVTSRAAWLLGVVVATGAIGCNGRPGIEPIPGAVKGLTPAEADARAEVVRRDPAAYLQRVAEKCRGLQQYTLDFTRFERRGLLQTMFGPEHIACWFRQQPFSVRMKWKDENVKYGESVFVEGQAGNQVRFVTRWWSPPLLPPPGINKVDLQAPVIWGESKRPMTDFGLQRLMERTLDSYRRAGKEVVISYRGLIDLPEQGPSAHYIHLEYPPSQHAVPIQELYIDVATDLPAGTILRYPDGRIDAAYYYYNLKSDVRLSDSDFLLEPERTAPDNQPKPAAPK